MVEEPSDIIRLSTMLVLSAGLLSTSSLLFQQGTTITGALQEKVNKAFEDNSINDLSAYGMQRSYPAPILHRIIMGNMYMIDSITMYDNSSLEFLETNTQAINNTRAVKFGDVVRRDIVLQDVVTRVNLLVNTQPKIYMNLTDDAVFKELDSLYLKAAYSYFVDVKFKESGKADLVCYREIPINERLNYVEVKSTSTSPLAEQIRKAKDGEFVESIIDNSTIPDTSTPDSGTNTDDEYMVGGLKIEKYTPDKFSTETRIPPGVITVFNDYGDLLKMATNDNSILYVADDSNYTIDEGTIIDKGALVMPNKKGCIKIKDVRIKYTKDFTTITNTRKFILPVGYLKVTNGSNVKVIEIRYGMVFLYEPEDQNAVINIGNAEMLELPRGVIRYLDKTITIDGNNNVIWSINNPT